MLKAICSILALLALQGCAGRGFYINAERKAAVKKLAMVTVYGEAELKLTTDSFPLQKVLDAAEKGLRKSLKAGGFKMVKLSETKAYFTENYPKAMLEDIRSSSFILMSNKASQMEALMKRAAPPDSFSASNSTYLLLKDMEGGKLYSAYEDLFSFPAQTLRLAGEQGKAIGVDGLAMARVHVDLKREGVEADVKKVSISDMIGLSQMLSGGEQVEVTVHLDVYNLKGDTVYSANPSALSPQKIKRSKGFSTYDPKEFEAAALAAADLALDKHRANLAAPVAP